MYIRLQGFFCNISFLCMVFVQEQGSNRPPQAASRGSHVGLSVRKRLDPSGVKSDAELLVTDPLLFMKVLL